MQPAYIEPESRKFASDDVNLIESKEGKKGKVRILVGTDITDNYIMIIGSAREDFAANEKTIDIIWGSFEMWSGVY